jgi:hypothetical protein
MADMAVLVLEGARIPAREFLSTARDLVGMLVRINMCISRERRLEWVISALDTGSTTFAVAPTYSVPGAHGMEQDVIASLVRGLRSLEEEPIRPQYFDDDLLRLSKRLVQDMDGGIVGVVVEHQRHGRRIDTARLTRHIADHVDDILGPPQKEVGSVEGVLETLSIHETEHVQVYDPITGRGTRCEFSPEVFQELLAYLGHRVVVFGEIQTRGRERTVKATSYRVLRGGNELPDILKTIQELSILFMEVEYDDFGAYVRKGRDNSK